MTQTIFSGRVNANDGFDSPAPVHGPSGWTVDKQQQTEIYTITHNLDLADPEDQLHVAVTAMGTDVVATVEEVAANTFRVSTWFDQQLPIASDFMFVAVWYRDRPGRK